MKPIQALLLRHSTPTPVVEGEDETLRTLSPEGIALAERARDDLARFPFDLVIASIPRSIQTATIIARKQRPADIITARSLYMPLDASRATVLMEGAKGKTPAKAAENGVVASEMRMMAATILRLCEIHVSRFPLIIIHAPHVQLITACLGSDDDDAPLAQSRLSGALETEIAPCHGILAALEQDAPFTFQLYTPPKS